MTNEAPQRRRASARFAPLAAVAASRSPGSRATGGPRSPPGSSATRRSSTSPGIDSRPPPADLERTEFIEADIRSPVLSRLLPQTGGRHGRPLRDPLVSRAGPPAARAARDQRDRDAAAARRLRADRDPAHGRRPRLGGDLRLRAGGALVLHRGHGARATPLRTRFQRDISELEEYFENFARRHPELRCCMLRFQPEIGADAREPAGPLPDAARACRSSSASTRGCSSCTPTTRPPRSAAAIANPVRGAVNVAPDGAISLSRALRLLGRPAVAIPHPLFGAVIGRSASRLRAGGPARRRDPAAALRPRRRQPPAARGGRLRAAYDAAAAIRDLARKRGAGRPRSRPGASHVGALARERSRLAVIEAET